MERLISREVPRVATVKRTGLMRRTVWGIVPYSSIPINKARFKILT